MSRDKDRKDNRSATDFLDKLKWTALRKAQFNFTKKSLPPSFPGASLIDLGAGAGQFGELFAGFQQISVDIDNAHNPDVLADLEQPLPFHDNSFDVVVSSNTFEHIYEVRNLVKECYRITKRGGMIVGSTPFLLSAHQAPHDYHRYTIFSLQKMLAESGYQKITIVPLATTYDLLKQTQFHFYGRMFDITKNKIAVRVFVKIAWNFQKLLNLLFSPLLKQNPQSPEFTLGYGFTGHKL